MKKETGMTYQAARKELEALVEELERPNADLGQIAAKVKRALELVKFCRKMQIHYSMILKTNDRKQVHLGTGSLP